MAHRTQSINEDTYLGSYHQAPRWYAVYTRSRHEKSVRGQLTAKQLDSFLPLHRVAHRWKNRTTTTVELPLFPGYMFVHLRASDYKPVIETPGVVAIVGSRGIPVALDDMEIEALRRCSEDDSRVEPHPYLPSDTRVMIKSGPFAGLTGTVVRDKGNWRLVLSVDLIMRSYSIEVDACDVEKETTSLWNIRPNGDHRNNGQPCY